MDVSSLLKWDSNEDDSKKSKRLSSSTFSVVQDNISNFFYTEQQDTSTTSINNSKTSKDTIVSPINDKFFKTNESPTLNKTSSKQQNNTLSNQLSDRLIEKLFAMALPPSNDIEAGILKERVEAGKERPGLSVPLVSKNFILLNARLSAPFELIDDIIKFFNWENPSLTITILLIYTNLILKPIPVLLSSPFLFFVIYIMAPVFQIRHQPDENTVLGTTNPILSSGPPLKDFDPPKPAPQVSREFILNLTDLQNHMLLYVKAWDFVVKGLSKFAYFKDEPISNFCYLVFSILGILSLLFGDCIIQFIPIKLIAIIVGWGFTITFHPYCYDWVFNLVYSENTRYYILNKTNKFESTLYKEFDFLEPQEQREIEIFEIHQFNNEAKEWNLTFFLKDDFTKLSYERLNYKDSNQPIGSTSLKLVKPPKNWEFIENDKWKIDLYPESWVESNLLQDFVTIDNETKWVYDKVTDQDGKTIEQKPKHKHHHHHKHGDDEINNEINENTIDPLNAQFRRRRWVRSVTRHSETIGSQSEIESIDSQSINEHSEVLTSSNSALSP